MSQLPPGLYAITDSKLLASEQLVEVVAFAIQGGAQMIQYRNKVGDAEQRQWEASDLNNMCRALGVPLIINDDVEMAAQVMAAGVHLGKDDTDVADARTRLGPRAIIGVSCYNDIDCAVAAEKAGADYVAFGSFFASRVKPEAVKAELALLQEAKQKLKIPVVAIGGIMAKNTPDLIESGADAVAVISAVLKDKDPQRASREISSLFAAE